MKFALVLCGLVVWALAEKVKYENYKVFRITPENESEVQVLLDLEANNPGVIFWKHVRNVGLPADVMVPPHLHPLMEGLKDLGIKYDEMVHDVQSLIDVEAMGSLTASPRLSWTAYYPVSEIYAFMEEVAASHPTIATTGSYGTSFEGRDLRYIKLNKGNTDKPIIWIDANIHAREWISNTIATWVIKELTSGASQWELDRFNFYIIPMMNPDGYEYTRSTDRMWSKTRSNYGDPLCKGADPNRNFAFGWNTGGSPQPCSNAFKGVAPLSEPEVRATVDFFDSVATDPATSDVVLYLSLHSYGQLILIPYGGSLGPVDDIEQHMMVGSAAATAIRQKFGTTYVPGHVDQILIGYGSGSSMDHMKGVYDTDLVFTFELRDTVRYGFILPPDQIEPSCQEFMDGFHAILSHLDAKQFPDQALF